LICITAILFILSGCIGTQFGNAYSLFNDTFVSATQFIADNPKEDDIQLLEHANLDDLNFYISKMEDYRSVMVDYAHSENEKRMLEEVEIHLNEVEFFQYALQNADDLTNDENLKLMADLGCAEFDREKMEKK
jgi:hypothetical protein